MEAIYFQPCVKPRIMEYGEKQSYEEQCYPKAGETREAIGNSFYDIAVGTIEIDGKTVYHRCQSEAQRAQKRESAHEGRALRPPVMLRTIADEPKASHAQKANHITPTAMLCTQARRSFRDHPPLRVISRIHSAHHHDCTHRPTPNDSMNRCRMREADHGRFTTLRSSHRIPSALSRLCTPCQL